MTRVMNFQNDEGLTASGKGCSPPNNDNSPPSAGYSPPKCQTYFRVCLSHFQAKINHSNCTFGSSLTPVYRIDNSIHYSTSNPFETRIHFNFAWPGDFSLTIEAWNDVNSSPQTDPSTPDPRPRPNDELIFRHNQSYLNLMPSELWVSNGSSGSRMTLTFQMRVTCVVNYYGSNCTTFCNSRNDGYGHYECNKTDGSKICLEGWKNPENYCMEAVCKRCIHGICKNNCSCHEGWTGPSCDICIPSDTCDPVHGYCTEPGSCLCKPGWGGSDCSSDLQYCSHHVNTCENGGTCLNSSPGNFSCACAKGFSGRTCSERVISSPCDPLDQCPCPLDWECKCPLGCTTSTTTTTSLPVVETGQTTGGFSANQSTTKGSSLSNGQKLTLILVFGVALPVLILIVAVVVHIVCRQRRRPPPSKDIQNTASGNNQQQQNNNQNPRTYNKSNNCEVVIRNDCSKINKNPNLLTNSMAREKTVSKSAPPLPKPLPLASPQTITSQSGFDKFNKNLNRQNHTYAYDIGYPNKDHPQSFVPLRPYPKLDEGGNYQHRSAYKSVVVSLEPGSKSPKRHDATIPHHDFPAASTDFYYVSSLSSDDSSVFSSHSNEEKIEATVV